MRATAHFCPLCRTRLVEPPEPAVAHQLPPPLSTDQSPPSAHPLAERIGRFGTGELRPLTTLADRYVIIEKIAQGGMGAVYKAHDRRLKDKLVAVKEMSESAIAPAERERVLDSFQREAELLARLEHPNLARVTDRFQEGDRHYIVMELVVGQTLQKILQGRSDPFTEEQVLVWADQLCDVLSYLHSQTPKIIYRDVKPANVMLLNSSDTVKLIDFGIARFFKPGKGQDTIAFGTDGYAPPEQYGQFQTDEQADVYALGATLHQLLTLRNPLTEMFNFPPVRSLNPDVSRRVEAAITKALVANKDKRHQSIEEMRIALVGDQAIHRLKPGRHLPTRKETGRPATPLSPLPGQATAAAPSVDFGPVLVGDSTPSQPLVVTFPAGEKVTLDTDSPWLQVHPRSISKSDDQGLSTVTVALETTRLQPGRLQLQGGWLKRWAGWPARLLVPAEQKTHAHVEIESEDGHVEHIPVSVTVVPKKWQVWVGWILTIGAVLLEVLAVIGVLGILALKMLR